MSAFGGKADMAFALQMSAFDPKRKWCPKRRLIYRDEPANTAVCQNFLHSNVMKSPSAFWGTRTRRGFHLPERTQRYTHAARHPGYDLIQLRVRPQLRSGCWVSPLHRSSPSPSSFQLSPTKRGPLPRR